ncbi:MAG TPA: hypothetical protein PKM25_17030, partial [Candidatus Ozemobacteraceae bacterium]|nr:hypothetical protein [Candidatus Ozemobacteraceae bacterium]
MNHSMSTGFCSKVRSVRFSAFLFAALLFLASAANPALCSNQKAGLKWGPVMGLINPENASIKWATTAPAKCSVICNGQTVAKVKSSNIFHEIFLDGLTPGTAFEY